MGSRFTAAVCAGAFLFAWSVPGRARDLVELGRILTPAYTAMSLANLCSMEPEWRNTQPRGLHGVAIRYAQHVKDEMVEGLSSAEAMEVLRFAAGRARDEARRQLNQYVYPGEKSSENARFKAWCTGHVSRIIAEFIHQHDGRHVEFMEQLLRAKADGTL